MNNPFEFTKDFNTTYPLRILDIKIMQGANYFSAGNVVVMLLDLCDYDEVFTNNIPRFYQKLSSLLPSLIEHHCSVGKRGGFFIRVKEGTLLGHVTEHVAIELQTLAGMDVGFGKTRESTKKGVYNVVVRYFDEQAGIFALKSAVALINSILNDTNFDVKYVINRLVEIRENRLFGPSTQAIIKEAENRKIPYFRLDEYNLVQLGTGKYLKQIRATLTSDTNFIAVETADDKFLTYKMLQDAGIPVPKTYIYSQDDEFDFEKFVVKPRFGNLGKGISIIKDKTELKQAVEYAQEFSKDVLIQNFIKGHTYRLLIIDYKFVAATRIDPPTIKGDGKHTVWELIEELNSHPQRGIGDKTPLSEMKIDEQTELILKREKLSLDTILPKDRVVKLKISSNLKLGGTSIDVTDVVHHDNIFASERAARFLGLNVAGIDLIIPDIRKSIFNENGAIVEVNAAPDFRMHLMPMSGKKRNVAKPLLDMMFSKENPNHIPLIAITGTTGKELTAKIIEKALYYADKKVGSFYKNSIKINNFPIKAQSVISGVRRILKDPTVDICVAEIPLESILNEGLAYQFADIGVVLNVEEKYKNLDSYVYIRDLDDVAYAKSVVAEEVYKTGWTILNADDALVYQMKKRIWSNLLIFSQKKSNAVKYHITKGGRAVYIRYNKIVYEQNNNITEFEKPADFDSYPHSYLAAVAVLSILKIDKDVIKKVLV